MEKNYTKEKLLIMLEEIQEELEILDATLLNARNQKTQLVKKHMTSLNNIEKGMAAMEKKIAASQSGLPSKVPPRQMPLYLNLAK